MASALERGKRVVPVLVDGAMFPLQEDFPEDLRPLAYRQAVSLRDHSWDSDIRMVLRALDGILTTTPAPAARARVPRPGSLLSRLKAAWRVLSPRGDDPPSQVRAPVPDVPGTPGTNASAAPPLPGHLVFVSYVSEDQARADDIVTMLEEDGRRCWISHRELVGGEDSWPGAVVGAIAASRVVVILVTQHSVKAKHVLREVTIADDENVPMLALCADKTPLSPDLKYFFTASQRLDVSDITWPQALTQLRGAVERRLV